MADLFEKAVKSPGAMVETAGKGKMRMKMGCGEMAITDVRDTRPTRQKACAPILQEIY